MAEAMTTVKIRIRMSPAVAALRASVFALREALEVVPEWHPEVREQIEEALGFAQLTVMEHSQVTKPEDYV